MPGFLSVRPGDWAVPPAVAGVVHAYIAADNAGVFAYTSETDAWTDISPVAGWPFHAIAAYGAFIWAVQTDSTETLHHSSDSGATWGTVALPGSGDGAVETLSASNDGATVVLAYNGDSTASDGIYTRPMDGSGAWSQVSGVAGATVFSAEMVGSRIWYAQQSGTAILIRYVIGGSVTTVSGAVGEAGAAANVSSAPLDQTIAYAFEAFRAAGSRIFRCVNGVGTDVSIPGSPTTTQALIVGAASADGTVVVALFHDNTGANTTTIYRSDDGGTTWASVHTAAGLAQSNWPGVRWSPTVTDQVVASWGDRIAISHDAGLTWTDSAAGAHASVVALL